MEKTTATVTCTFTDADVATGKTVTCLAITLASNWQTNYVLSTTSKTTTVTIVAKSIVF